jgi:bacteriorhodopsin
LQQTVTMQFLKRGNSLEENPNLFTFQQSADITINDHGSNWLWAATAVMAVSTIAFLACTWKVPRGNRIFHWIFAAATVVSTIAYFSMASNLGYTPIIVEFSRTNAKVAGVTRAIFYVRYIQYALTTPVSKAHVISP